MPYHFAYRPSPSRPRAGWQRQVFRDIRSVKGLAWKLLFEEGRAQGLLGSPAYIAYHEAIGDFGPTTPLDITIGPARIAAQWTSTECPS